MKPNVFRNDVESPNKKLAELNEDEMNQVVGGSADESADDIIQRNSEEIRRAIEGLLNPSFAYDSTMSPEPAKPSFPEINR